MLGEGQLEEKRGKNEVLIKGQRRDPLCLYQEEEGWSNHTGFPSAVAIQSYNAACYDLLIVSAESRPSSGGLLREFARAERARKP